MGGGEVALLNLIAALDRTRYEPVVLLFGDGPLREKLQAIDVPVCIVALDSAIADARKDALGDGPGKLSKTLTAAKFLLRLRKAIRRAKVDLVHTNSLKSDLLGGLAARLAGRPVVWHVRDRIADDYLPPRVVKMFRTIARRVPTALIANSRATLETLIPAGDPPRVGKKRAFIVHDGTHLPAAVTSPVRKNSACVIGLVGRLAPWKGQHVFIEAAARVRAKFPDAKFRIIGSALFGEDEYERGLRASVDALGLADTVEFAGFRSDVEQAIAELDILVHASTTGEPFGQVIIEGMAAGKPVIATRGGGVPEIVPDGKAGLLVPMGDGLAMANAIETLLTDAAARQAMGRAGRAHVEAHFTMAHVAANVQRAFDQILDGR